MDNRRMRVIQSALLALVLPIAGCSRELPKAAPKIAAVATPETSNAASASADAQSPDQGEPSPGAGPAFSNPGIPDFGVPECDKYVRKYLGCVEGRVTGLEKERLTAAFEANLAKWRALAAMREGKIAMALACRTATAASRESLNVDYGCEF